MSKKIKTPKLRCFVGINFTLHRQIGPLLSELEEFTENASNKLRIAPPENLHITLKFLGPVDGERLTLIRAVLERLKNEHHPFELRCKGIGVFNNSMWIGIVPDNHLHTLVTDMNQAFSAQRFGEEQHPFVPHVTIARFSPGSKSKFDGLLHKHFDREWGTIQVKEYQLFKSDTLATGPKYSVIGNYSLKPQPE